MVVMVHIYSAARLRTMGHGFFTRGAAPVNPFVLIMNLGLC